MHLVAALRQAPPHADAELDVEDLLMTRATTLGGVGDKLTAAMAFANMASDFGRTAAELLEGAQEELLVIRVSQERGGARRP